MKTSLESYRQSREALLAKIVTELSDDQRFAAAWLTGSYARNDADQVSDLDLQVVVARPYSDVLCLRKEQVSHQTTEERLALFSQFGQPALIHENNNNAPEGGTFTFVLYSDSALMVDWTLIPQANAIRPHSSLLLFDKGNLPVAAPAAPDDLETSKKAVAEIWAFFWMMAAVTIKYIFRGNPAFVSYWLGEMQGMILEIERRLEIAKKTSAIAPSTEVPFGVPDSFSDHVRLHWDLMVTAFQGDISRVTTIMLSRDLSPRPYPESGTTAGNHPASHYGDGEESRREFAKINRYFMQEFAYFAKKLKETPDGDGNLLDHSVLLWGSGMSDSNSHSALDVPYLMVGKGAGLFSGNRHLAAPRGTPLANVMLTVAQKFGAEIDRFGVSTGAFDLNA